MEGGEGVNATTALPEWLQYLWAISGSTALCLAILWTAAIFYPYLRRMERKQDRALALGEQTARLLADVQRDVAPLLADADRLIQSAGPVVQDVGRAVQAWTPRTVEENCTVSRLSL